MCSEFCFYRKCNPSYRCTNTSFSDLTFCHSVICLFPAYYCLLCLMECCPLLFSSESSSVYHLVLTLTDNSHIEHRGAAPPLYSVQNGSPREYSQQIFLCSYPLYQEDCSSFKPTFRNRFPFSPLRSLGDHWVKDWLLRMWAVRKRT